jgi:predicted nuclease of restriction endonuclease-like (RecB) superfamily
MVPKHYQELLTSLKAKIRVARSISVFTVNSQILSVYWEIGKTIKEMEIAGGWGSKTVERLASDLKSEFPEMKGLSPRSLRYMREFCKAYPNLLKLQPSAAKLSPISSKTASRKTRPILRPPAAKLEEPRQEMISLISWTHHQVILDRVKTTGDRLFYIQKTVENGWSRNVLALQIDGKLHERQGKAISNFELTLPLAHSDLVKETIKSPYFLDFLESGEEMKERDLEKALIHHIKDFLLELGRGFAYVGNQYNIQVEGDEFFLDLLFFNYNLNCFVVLELKVGDFIPEYAGKLNFYINTVDKQIRAKKHNRTIGILLCKTPNKTVIRYALEGVKRPIAVSDFKLSKALPKALKGEMPTSAELEQELDEETKKLKSPTEKRFETLKRKLASLDKEQITTATFPLLLNLYISSIKPLFENLLLRVKEFEEYFLNESHFWYGGNVTFYSLEDLDNFWKDEEKLKSTKELNFQLRLSGFKLAGINAFDIVAELAFVSNQYWYGFRLTNYDNQQVFKKKLYTQSLTKDDIAEVCNLTCDQIMDRIEPFL